MNAVKNEGKTVFCAIIECLLCFFLVHSREKLGLKNEGLNAQALIHGNRPHNVDCYSFLFRPKEGRRNSEKYHGTEFIIF